MAKRRDDGKIGISMRFSPIQHYQLKKMADVHNRGLNDEVISLIEETAARMRMQLDIEDEAVEKYIKSESERMGISIKDATERVKKRYSERQQILIEGTKREIDIPDYEEKEKRIG
jgi:adenylosuccinate synthase